MKNKPILAVLMILIGLTVAAAQSPASADYRIKAGDILSVYVLEEPTLSVRHAVVSNGKIEVPLIGSVQAEGLSLREFRQIVHGRLTRHLTDPKVAVSLRLF